MNNDLSIHQAIGNNTVQNLRAAIMNEFKNSRFESVHNPVGPSGRDSNKLRSYALFKMISKLKCTVKSYCPFVIVLRLLNSAVERQHCALKLADSKINPWKSVNVRLPAKKDPAPPP